MTKDEALKLALEALGEIEWSNNSQWQSDRAKVAITAIKEALAQPEQDRKCRLCGEDQTFTGTCGGGKENPTALCFTPPLPVQAEERNFCPRCGKRTADLTTIHTCTPPQEKDV